jgi:hypothetical protein
MCNLLPHNFDMITYSLQTLNLLYYHYQTPCDMVD